MGDGLLTSVAFDPSGALNALVSARLGAPSSSPPRAPVLCSFHQHPPLFSNPVLQPLSQKQDGKETGSPWTPTGLGMVDQQLLLTKGCINAVQPLLLSMFPLCFFSSAGGSFALLAASL